VPVATFCGIRNQNGKLRTGKFAHAPVCVISGFRHTSTPPDFSNFRKSTRYNSDSSKRANVQANVMNLPRLRNFLHPSRRLGTSAGLSVPPSPSDSGAFFSQLFSFLQTPSQPKNFAQTYELGQTLGSGRFGVVHKGICRQHGTEVAIKNIPKSAISSFNSDFCIKEELDILRFLQNSGRREDVINIIDSFEDDSDVFIVSDLYTGGELFDHVVDKGDDTLSEVAAARIIKQVLEAVQYLHKKNVTHRDLKPENIVFKSMEKPDIVLVDFGNATKFKQGEFLYDQTGTSLYVAPEVLKGDGYDQRADAWSVGVVLYITMTGEPPFEGDTTHDIEENVMRGNFRLDGGIWNYISDNGKDLVRKLMCVDVNDRLTIDEALQHEWFTTVQEDAAFPVPASVVASLRSSLETYSNEGKLRRKIVQKLSEDHFLDRDNEDSNVRDLKQLKHSLKEMYTSMDIDADGGVSVVELGHALKKMNVVTNVQGLDLITSQLEKEKNVTFEDFFAAAAWHEILQFTVTADCSIQEEQKLRDAFEYFDMNGSGQIDASDLHRMFGGSYDDAKTLIQRYDVDDSGEICFEEFKLIF
jgi:calcium-dependent protein kinase